jgi:hypothetical protein
MPTENTEDRCLTNDELCNADFEIRKDYANRIAKAIEDEAIKVAHTKLFLESKETI